MIGVLVKALDVRDRSTELIKRMSNILLEDKDVRRAVKVMLDYNTMLPLELEERTVHSTVYLDTLYQDPLTTIGREMLMSLGDNQDKPFNLSKIELQFHRKFLQYIAEPDTIVINEEEDEETLNSIFEYTKSYDQDISMLEGLPLSKLATGCHNCARRKRLLADHKRVSSRAGKLNPWYDSLACSVCKKTY